MRKSAFVKALCGAFLGTAVLSACVDDKYDLSNLDKNMQIGKGGTITLPTSNTSDIQLRNLFDLAEDGPISTIADPNGRKGNNGELLDSIYYLDKDGNSNPTPINVDKITIPAPTINEFRAYILQSPEVAVKGQNQRRAGASKTVFYYNFEDLATAYIPIATSATISEDVTDLTRIGFDENLTKVTFKVHLEKYGHLKTVHYDNLALRLPAGMEISDDVHYSDIRNGQRRDTKGRLSNDNGTTVITFFDGEDEGSDANGEAIITMRIKAANITEKGKGSDFNFNPTSHHATLDSKIQMVGYMRVDEADLDLSNLTLEEQMKIATEGQSALIPKDIVYVGGGTFDNDLVVTTFSGSIEHAIDNINDIELTDIPDFLEGDDVTLDLNNPELILIVNTDLPTKAYTQISLEAFRDGEQTVKDLTTDRMELDGTTGKTLIKILAKDPRPDAVAIPNDYMNDNYHLTGVAVPNIGKLIERIPDKIRITGTGKNGAVVVTLPNCENLKINQNYNVNIAYRIYSPLTFGDNFQIVYRDTEDGFDIGDGMDDIDIQQLCIDATTISDIPLALNLDVTPLGLDGSDISNTVDILYYHQNAAGEYVKMDPLVIRANADGTKSEDKIRIILKNKDSQKGMNSFLSSKAGKKQLDGLKYSATMNNPSSNSQALKTSSSLRLTDLKMSVIDGVTIYDND